MRRPEEGWDEAWAGATVEHELATLSYPWVQPALHFIRRRLVPGQPVLEAGCGPGRLVYWLRTEGSQPFGIDCSLPALQKARGHSSALAQADVRRLPFGDATFGTCLSLGVIEHLGEGPEACLDEAWRVLRPGGALIVAVPHVNLLAQIDPPLKALYRRLRGMGPPVILEPPGR